MDHQEKDVNIARLFWIFWPFSVILVPFSVWLLYRKYSHVKVKLGSAANRSAQGTILSSLIAQNALKRCLQGHRVLELDLDLRFVVLSIGASGPGISRRERPQRVLKTFDDMVDLPAMLYAVKPAHNLGPIEVPPSLDDIDGLLTLRGDLEEAMHKSIGDIVLDCSLLCTISSPALGWLVELAWRLFQHDRFLVLSGASAELCLRFRTLGPELPGITLVRN